MPSRDASREPRRAVSATRTASARARSAAMVGSTRTERVQDANVRASSSTMARARATSSPVAPVSVSARMASTSRTVTPGSVAQTGSTSRGTAMSSSTSGRPARPGSAASASSRVITGVDAPVQDSTTSAASSPVRRSSRSTTSPSTRAARRSARSRVRLATRIRPATPSRRSPASWPIFPAPTSRTVRPPSPLTMRSAAPSATSTIDDAPRSSPVSARTRRPTRRAWRNIAWSRRPTERSRSASAKACFTWAAISRSPTTIESRPDVTANRCAAARSSKWS